MLVCLMLAGCRTVRYVPVETVRTDSVYVDRFTRDSVYTACTSTASPVTACI